MKKTEVLESREPGDGFTLQNFADRFGVERSTLAQCPSLRYNKCSSKTSLASVLSLPEFQGACFNFEDAH
jgi:hypothetical protein